MVPSLGGLAVVIVSNVYAGELGRQAGTFSVPISLFSLELGFLTPVLLRVTLTGAGIVSLLSPLFFDYSKLFPTQLRMTVHYDDEGIERILNTYSSSEKARLKIRDDWVSAKADYMDQLDQAIGNTMDGYTPFFSRHESMYSAGETSFVVEKVDGSWQRYRIVESHGRLEHTLELPEREPCTLISEFVLRRAGYDFIELTLADILFRFTVILKPQYKQILRVTSAREVYSRYVIALNKVRIFPLLTIGDTVYLAETDEGRIPVGYTVYAVA